MTKHTKKQKAWLNNLKKGRETKTGSPVETAPAPPASVTPPAVPSAPLLGTETPLGPAAPSSHHTAPAAETAPALPPPSIPMARGSAPPTSTGTSRARAVFQRVVFGFLLFLGSIKVSLVPWVNHGSGMSQQTHSYMHIPDDQHGVPLPISEERQRNLDAATHVKGWFLTNVSSYHLNPSVNHELPRVLGTAQAQSLRTKYYIKELESVCAAAPAREAQIKSVALATTVAALATADAATAEAAIANAALISAEAKTQVVIAAADCNAKRLALNQMELIATCDKLAKANQHNEAQELLIKALQQVCRLHSFQFNETIFF
jgi:hypothetical protein